MPTGASAILTEGARLLARAEPAIAARLNGLAQALALRSWNVLVSGLCSVGKSSVVCALWGDAELLPTAVRDCTQTNTLIRRPADGESDRRILLHYLEWRAAENFALKGLAVHRLLEMLQEYHGLAMPRLDELPPDARLRFVAADAERLYASRRDLMVLNEPLTDELEQLKDFIAFLDSPEYRPGEAVEAQWDERREHLMGKRLLDGRLAGTGKLMALEHVELVSATHWRPGRDLPVPAVIDTPWIPALHNARRQELILAQARAADVLLVLTLPQAFQPEPWLLAILKERPDLRRSTIVVFNQIDTCDPRTLFSRDGFLGTFAENREQLEKLGLDPANMLTACSRLRFLQDSQKSDTGRQSKLPFGTSALSERIARLEKTLGQLREQGRSRPDSDFKTMLMAACDVNDAGIETLRRRMEELAAGVVARRRTSEALDALLAFEAVDLPPDVNAKWSELRLAASGLKRS
jgi:hypothetical protein